LIESAELNVSGCGGGNAFEGKLMQAVKIIIWQDGDAWLGYLQEYPDYWTQGESLDDLKEHLKDLYADLSSGAIQGARRVEDLIVS